MAPSIASSDARLETAYAEFVGRFPAYAETVALDRLRATEYRRLDECGQVYLDYTGSSLFAESQLEDHLKMMRSGILGNPHSNNPTSAEMTGYLESTRRAILNYFNASVDEYTLVFTANASGALKLVGESFPFGPQGRLLLTFDNHNSVNGIREFARTKGAGVDYVPLLAPALRLDLERLDSLLNQADPAIENLFAFPAQSNFSGVKHPLDLVANAQRKGWRVLLAQPLLRPPTAWTSRLANLILSPSRFTRCSAIRPESEPCSCDDRPCRFSGDPGSLAAL